jgi:broad specificity phosphatase PhoE
MGEMIDFTRLAGRADFYFVRHGESEANKAGRMQGRGESALSSRGREQAREAGLWMRERKIDAVLTSPLARCRATAEIIAETARIADVRVAEELTELDTGVFSDLTFAEARERFPGAWDAFQRQSWEGVPGAEPARSLYARAAKAWDVLFREQAAGRAAVLAVTHSGFLQWIIRSTVGLKTWMPLFSASTNCCISHLRVDNRALGDGQSSYYVNWMMLNAPPAAARFHASVDGTLADK